MKKLMALAIAVVMLAAICAIPASADFLDLGTLYEYTAEKYDEIMDGEAGEATMKWNVPYQAITPVLDGVINKNEYARFENFEDYIGVSATSNYGKEATDALYEKVKGGFFDAYWCWDGQYLYMAFDVDAIDGYDCTPTQDVMLFAYNCLQIGLADVDASGRDTTYTELGFGYNQEKQEDISFTWNGRYQSAADDFTGKYDEAAKRVTYELRIDLQLALGWEKYPENGDQCNFAFVMEVQGDKDENKNAQVLFCHGIGGQYSMKMTEYFARITFEGKPDDVVFDPKDPTGGVSEEDLEYELREVINFADTNVFNTMVGEGASVEQITEGEDTFLRVTAQEDGCYVYSTAYPRNLLSDARYLVIKYRTNSAKADECGIIWQTRQELDFRVDECYFDFTTGDGNWNYMLADMNGDAKWMDYIQTLGLVPFYDEEGIAGETIDIAWIKCYNQDPYDLYEQYLPTTEETTEEPTVETEGGDATTNAPEQGGEQTTEAPEQKNGCGSVIGASVLAVVAIMGTAVVLKKKD